MPPAPPPSNSALPSALETFNTAAAPVKALNHYVGNQVKKACLRTPVSRYICYSAKNLVSGVADAIAATGLPAKAQDVVVRALEKQGVSPKLTVETEESLLSLVGALGVTRLASSIAKQTSKAVAKAARKVSSVAENTRQAAVALPSHAQNIQIPADPLQYLAKVIETSEKMPSMFEGISPSLTEQACLEIPGGSFDLEKYLFQDASQQGLLKPVPLNARVVLFSAKDPKKHGHLEYVKKTDALREILYQLKAQNIFQRLPLQHSQVARVLGIQLSNGDAHLFTTRLPGQPLAHFLKEVEKFSIGHPQRPKALEIAGQALKHLGIALGELHSIMRKANFPIPRSSIRHDVTRLKDDYSFVREYNLELPYTQQTIQSLADSYIKRPGPASFVVEDAHFENFLYDPSTSRLSLVDLFAEHVTSAGIPQANPMRSFHRILRFLELDIRGFSEAERQLLTSSFRDHYRAAFAGGVPQESYQFHNIASQYATIVDLIEEEVNPELIQRLIPTLSGD